MGEYGKVEYIMRERRNNVIKVVEDKKTMMKWKPKRNK